MRRALVVGCVVFGLVTVAGCNDDQRLTAEEFKEEANAICAEGSEQIDGKIEALVGDAEPSPEQMQVIVETVTDEVQSQLDKIRDLNPPEEMEEDIDAALDSAEADVEEVRDRGPEALQSEEDPFAETSALMADLGLTDCSLG